MKGGGKLNVVLSWDDNNYCCQFLRGRHQEDWNEMSLDEQKRSIGAMMTMADLFQHHLKKEDK